jgi:serine/threonine protein kinase
VDTLEASETPTVLLGATPPSPTPASADCDLALVSRAFLDELMRCHLLDAADVAQHFGQDLDGLSQCGSVEEVGDALVRAGLLTDYQLKRILRGETYGLVLDNNRVLGLLGSGSMGTVYLAEHIFMRRRVAVKILPVDADCPPEVLGRFCAEMRVLADLRHPHIVMAYDAGTLSPTTPDEPALLYLVLELVPGGDLQKHVEQHGPVPVPQACQWAYEAASGLQEAHDNHLIHRDIKPSNLLLSADGHVKIVDFGLVRQFSSLLTGPRALLGTVDFMAPEQSQDSATVGSQADIYGLGATLFWLLTGEPPYPRSKRVSQALQRLQESPPRCVSVLRPDVPQELDALVRRMLDRDPVRRPALPLSIMRSLQPFCPHPRTGSAGPRTEAADEQSSCSLLASKDNPQRNILIT